MASLKKALKSVLAEAETLVNSTNGAPLTPEQVTQYESHIKRAEAIKAQIEIEDRAEKVAEWAKQPNGESVVKASYTGNALPGEGDIEQVTMDAKSGELYAMGGLGQTKIAALKSGAYKDAFNEYLRNTGLNRSMKAESMKVLNEGSDTSGGFWVPPDYRPDLVKKAMTTTFVRPNAYAFTTGSDLPTFPKVTYTTDDKYTSGVRFGWIESTPLASDISEATNPVAGRVTIPVHTATAAIFVTRTQLEDNQFDLLGYVSQLMAEAFALGEEDVFINGTGIGQPQGILTHPQAIVASSGSGMYVASGSSGTVEWGSGTSGSASVGKGIVGVEAALPPQYEANAKWLANKATWSALRGITDTTGRPLWNPLDAWPTMSNGYSATLLGYPVGKSQFMPDLAANAYPVLFGDFTGYYIADRVGLSIEVLREVRALKDEVVIYARKRVGGQLVHYWKLKDMKAAAS